MSGAAEAAIHHQDDATAAFETDASASDRGDTRERAPNLRRQWIAAIVFFLFWTVYETWPLVRVMGSTTHYDVGDGLLNAYILSWNLHALPTDPLHLFNASMYYPATHTLALSENMLALSVLFWPLDLIFKNPLLLCNAIILFSFITLALLAFGCVRHWTRSFWLGMIAGLAIGFAPYRFSQLTHMQLLNYQPLLLAIFFAERWTRSWRARDIAWLTFAMLLQMYTGIYLFVFAMVVMTAFLPILMFARRRNLPWTRAGVQIAAAALLFGILAQPVYQPYRYVRDVLGIMPDWKAILNSGINLFDLIHVDPYMTLYRPFFPGYSNPYSPAPWESCVSLPYSLWFLGFFALAAGVADLLWRKKHRKDDAPPPARPDGALFAALLLPAALCFTLMFGPLLHLNAEPLPSVPMPYAFYFRFFPGFEGMRVPPRFMFPFSVVFIFAAALAAGWMRASLGARGRSIFNATAALYCCFLCLELRTQDLVLKKIPTQRDLPGYVANLAARPPAPVFIWPASRVDSTEYLYLYYNAFYWFPMVNGRSGHMPREQAAILDKLIAKFPSPATLEMLGSLKVRYIVLQGVDPPNPALAREAGAKLEALAGAAGLKKTYEDDGAQIWELQAETEK